MEEVELILNNVVLALQLCLGLWQFMKLTPLGALIQGVMGWLLGRFGLSPTYAGLKLCEGHVFKEVDCFVLQADTPSERENNISWVGVKRIDLGYLRSNFVLEREETAGKTTLSIDGKEKRCYYITDTIWEELRTLQDVLRGPAGAGSSDAVNFQNIRYTTVLQSAQEEEEADETGKPDVPVADETGKPDVPITIWNEPQTPGEVPGRAVVLVKGYREFWEEVITGGVMTMDKVLDGIILYNQHVSSPLKYNWLLPVNMTVSEEKLLKILNLVGLFLQTKKVHWLIPTSLSIISALLEFTTRLRVLLYTNINLLFCYILHLICDPLPRSWRRQVYSFEKWVDNLKPSNDIQLKVVRGDVCAIIAGGAKLNNGAKVDKGDATSVDWLDVDDDFTAPGLDDLIECKYEKSRGVCKILAPNFTAPGSKDLIECKYEKIRGVCKILAPTFSEFLVECKSTDDFKRIITLVSLIAKTSCGSLISYDPRCRGESWICYGLHCKSKVRVRGFKESIISYVINGLPPVYKLELGNCVVVA